MRNSARKLLLVAGIAVAGFAMTMGTASAATPSGDYNPSACDLMDRGWTNWDTGSAELGGGAAKLVSGAWIGAPSSLLELGSPVSSPKTQAAWEDWNEGGAEGVGGAGKMVSGAFVGAPASAVCLGEATARSAGDVGSVDGDITD
jgi:hypothetical protein